MCAKQAIWKNLGKIISCKYCIRKFCLYCNVLSLIIIKMFRAFVREFPALFPCMFLMQYCSERGWSCEISDTNPNFKKEHFDFVLFTELNERSTVIYFTPTFQIMMPPEALLTPSGSGPPRSRPVLYSKYSIIYIFVHKIFIFIFSHGLINDTRIKRE